MKSKFLSLYLSELNGLFDHIDHELWLKMEGRLRALRDKAKGKVLIFGNGGSAAVAEHVSLDYKKAAGLPCLTLSSAPMLSCFANDFGYEHSQLKFIKYFATPDDVIVLISSSGKSPNILNCATYCEENALTYFTLTGFSEVSPIRQINTTVNFWIPVDNYNHIENAHQVILLSICDSLRER